MFVIKKFYTSIGIILLALLFFISNESMALEGRVCTKITSTLKLGSRDTLTSNQVAELQRFLAQNPSVYPEGIVSGYFGRLTQSAVIKWQNINNVYYEGKATGVIGPLSRVKIEEECKRFSVVEFDDGDEGDGESFPENSVTVIGRNGVFEKKYFENTYLQKYVLRIEADDRDYYFKIPNEGFNIAVPRGTTAMVDIGALSVGSHIFECGLGCSGTIIVK